MNNNATIISIKNLSKNYGPVPALIDLNLNIYRGEIFGFLGQNGAGKTTTIKLILNLIFPSAGSVRVFDCEPTDIAVRRRIGYLPEVLALPGFLTGEEFLDFHGRLCNIDKSRRQQRIAETLHLTGLTEARTKPLRAYSKGMTQRIGLAQAMLAAPELLILDEPTSALDPLARKEMRDVFVALREQGTAIFLNSHMLSEIERTCDRIGILHKGKLVYEGSPRQYLSDEKAVVVEVKAITDALLAVLDGVCRSIERDRNCLTLFLKQDADPGQIPALISTAGGELVSYQQKTESLEDLFYRLVKDAPQMANPQEKKS